MIKERIINKIENSDNFELLELIDGLFENNDIPSFQLTKLEKDALEISLKQFKDGETISNEIVQKEIEEWLSK